MKMLDDRESSVKSAKQLADNLLKNLDSREQKAIQNQSAQLQQRWDVLFSIPSVSITDGSKEANFFSVRSSHCVRGSLTS
jgi:hypothetical protein